MATSATVMRWPSMRGLPPHVPGVLTIRTRSGRGSRVVLVAVCSMKAVDQKRSPPSGMNSLSSLLAQGPLHEFLLSRAGREGEEGDQQKRCRCFRKRAVAAQRPALVMLFIAEPT